MPISLITVISYCIFSLFGWFVVKDGVATICVFVSDIG